MNKKKTLAAAVFSALLLISTTQPHIIYAASPSLSASSDTGSASAGEYVNVSVELGNNPDISTLGASLNYDSNVLKYDSSTWSSGFSGSDMQMASDTGSEVNLSVVCDDSYSADGTVVTVRFQALQDTSSIPVTLSLRDMADAELSEISDCSVASTVRTPSPAPANAANTEPEEENDTVDLQNPEEASGIHIVDEQSGQQPEDTAQEPAGHTEAAVSGTASGTNSESSVSASMAQGTGSAGGIQTSQSSGSSKPDSSYKTGIGLGSDILLIGAAVFGVLALILSVRRHKEG